MELARVVLKNNFFDFDGEFYHQLSLTLSFIISSSLTVNFIISLSSSILSSANICIEIDNLVLVPKDDVKLLGITIDSGMIMSNPYAPKQVEK